MNRNETEMKSNRRVGFFPITGDPIHYGHLYGAVKVLKIFSLETVFIQVCGDLPLHKPHKALKRHRHQMAKLAIKEFEPLLQYTPLGYDKALVGENLFVEFVQNPAFHNVSEFYYLAGVDNQNIVLERFKKNKNKIHRNYEIVFLARSGYCLSNNRHPIVSFGSHISSSSFRNHERIDIVPEPVLEYCREHHLYGY